MTHTQELFYMLNINYIEKVYIYILVLSLFWLYQEHVFEYKYYYYILLLETSQTILSLLSFILDLKYFFFLV